MSHAVHQLRQHRSHEAGWPVAARGAQGRMPRMGRAHAEQLVRIQRLAHQPSRQCVVLHSSVAALCLRARPWISAPCGVAGDEGDVSLLVRQAEDAGWAVDCARRVVAGARTVGGRPGLCPAAHTRIVRQHSGGRRCAGL